MTLTREQLEQTYREEMLTLYMWAKLWLVPTAAVQLVQDTFCRMLANAVALQQTTAGPMCELYDVANRIVSSWVVAGTASDDLPLWLDPPKVSADRQLRFVQLYCTVIKALHRTTPYGGSMGALTQPLRRDIAYLLDESTHSAPPALHELERSYLRRLLAAAEGPTHLSRKKETYLATFCDREVSRTYLGRGERVPQTRSEPHGENE